VFRVLAALMCALFLVSLAVQYNDPDPYLWMPIYGLAAWLAWTGVRGRLSFRANAIALAIYLALFAAWAPSLFRARAAAFEHWHMLAPDDEEPRESGGLAICAAWCAVQMVVARRR